MGIKRTSESLVPSQKNEEGKYLTTDGNSTFWSEVSGSSSGVTSLSGTLNEIEVSASVGNITLSLPSTINANTTGSAATLTTPRSIGLSGDVSGSANFDGSSNITITATVADDSHNHIISNIDGLQTALDGKQTLDADLTAIAALSGTSGFLKKTAADTWSLDTNTYLTGNQTITLTGDATGSGTTSISLTLANSGVSASTYGSSSQIPVIAVDAKGRITSASVASVEGLPSQTGNSGKYLTTNGTSASWDTIDLGTDTTGNYVATASAGSGIEISGSGSENAALTITNTGVTSLTGTANEVELSASAGAVQVGLPNEVRIESLGAGTASVDVTVENTTFIAVAINSSAAASSADGITWTDSTMPSSQAWRSASYGNGKFVAVAATNSAAATSTDGINWTARTMPSFQNWRSVAYGNSTFVAVAYLSAAAATSTDGITWTARTMPSSQRWRTPFYANNIFVAVASSSAAAATSTDGITWTARTMPSSQSWRSVSYGNSTFVAVSYNLAAATSTDGITWTARTMPSSQSWRSASYGNGRFVAIAINSAAAATSTDGITWTDSTMPSSQNWISVDYGNDIFVAVAYNSAAAATSTDGITWTARTMPSSQNWQSASYGNITTTTITPIAPNLVPTQTGNSGKYLTTDGTNSSWSSIPESLSPFLLGGM